MDTKPQVKGKSTGYSPDSNMRASKVVRLDVDQMGIDLLRRNLNART